MTYDYHIRELQVGDYSRGFMECLRELTVIGDVTEEMFVRRFQERNKLGVLTVVAVCNKTGNILGTASVFYEPKFIRECSMKGYIEDVSVAPYAQKMGIGRRLVMHLEEKAMGDGCYKVILTCGEENEEFYEKMHFKKIEVAMAIYSDSR